MQSSPSTPGSRSTFVPLSEAVAAIVKVTATDTSAGSTHGQGVLDGLRGLFMGHVWLPETVSRT